MIVRVVHARAVRRRRVRASHATARPEGAVRVDTARAIADHTSELRRRLGEAAAHFHGLETLIVGWRDIARIASDDVPRPHVVVTVWQDAESMVRAIGANEEGLLGDIGLVIAVQQADSYELTSRTFASLPAQRSVLRISTIRAHARGESEFFDRLRAVQQRFSERGLIASHIGRRVGPDGIDALVLGVWSDRAAIEAATGRIDTPRYLEEFKPWIDDFTIEIYDALEIAPRLPMSSGPPIMILDQSRRVVDLTPAAAATLGRTQEEAAEVLIEDLAGLDEADDAAQWVHLLDGGTTSDTMGSTAWLLPPEGRILIRWRLRRDVPVPGRHTILVRRSLEPEPSAEDLDAALSEAFPRVEVRTGG